MALQAISRHDGVVRVESSEGYGTTVMIWLPASTASKAQATDRGHRGGQARRPARSNGGLSAETCPRALYVASVPALARSL
jgi:hypothetical protein